jgi:holliday junction DNA helicase RuvB
MMDTPLQREEARIRESRMSAYRTAVLTAEPRITPTDTDGRSKNLMRPRTLKGVIGQQQAKELLTAGIARSRRTGEPMPHTLLTGSAGTGKTTLAHVIAHELDVEVYQFEAPLSHDTMVELADVMNDGDVLFLDEIHQQSLGDRRGRQATLQPEALYGVMEDKTLATATGVLAFPSITMIGATTDPGRLPEAFLSRFPLKPRLVEYTEADMVLMAARNAHVLDLKIVRSAARLFAGASRFTPREMNNLVTNAALWATGTIRLPDAERTLELCSLTHDGLTVDMVNMLTFLLTRGRRQTQQGVRYQASLSTIATAIGLSRDTKAVQLYVEPWLIRRGFVQVAHSGRVLTDAGIQRAGELAS